MNLQHIRAVAFDAYGTLVHATHGGEDPYRTLFRLLGLTPAEHRRAADLAMTSALELSQLADMLSPGHGLRLASLLRSLETVEASVELFPETVAVLRELRARGYPLVVVSNLAPPYARPVAELLAPLVDGFVWSFEVGHRKPQPEIFQAAVERLGVRAEEVLMVGDSFRSDVEGGRSAGLSALWLRREVGGDLSSLREIPDLVASR